MSIHQITDKDLAEPALAGIVDPELCALLLSADEEYLKVKLWIESRELFVTPLLGGRKFAQLLDSLAKLWPEAPSLRETDSAWRELKRRAGLPPAGCELCGARGAEAVRALAPSSEQGGGLAWHRCWSHPVNGVSLCFRHRADLASGRRPGEFRALVARRRQLNALVRRGALAELVRIRAAGGEARAAWRHLEKAAGRELSRLENKLH